MIADETVEKPEGWLDEEPEFVPDPSSERPEDWYVCHLILVFIVSISSAPVLH